MPPGPPMGVCTPRGGREFRGNTRGGSVSRCFGIENKVSSKLSGKLY